MWRVNNQITDLRPEVFMDYCVGGGLADPLRQSPPMSSSEPLDTAIQGREAEARAAWEEQLRQAGHQKAVTR